MADPQSDPASLVGAVTFDLENGLLCVDGASNALVVPADALIELCAAAGPQKTADLGRAMGGAMGRRLSARVAEGHADAESEVRAATTETLVGELGRELALAGLGSLGIERWGRALVLVVDHSPGGARGDALVAAVLEAALRQASGRELSVGRIGRDGVRARFFVGGGGAVDKLNDWLGAGMGWGEALVRLHGAASPGGEG